MAWLETQFKMRDTEISDDEFAQMQAVFIKSYRILDVHRIAREFLIFAQAQGADEVEARKTIDAWKNQALVQIEQSSNY